MRTNPTVHTLPEIAIHAKHLELLRIAAFLQPPVEFGTVPMNAFSTEFRSVVQHMIYSQKQLLSFSAAGAFPAAVSREYLVLQSVSKPLRFIGLELAKDSCFFWSHLRDFYFAKLNIALIQPCALFHPPIPMVLIELRPVQITPLQGVSIFASLATLPLPVLFDCNGGHLRRQLI